jgi:hypothetical protein
MNPATAALSAAAAIFFMAAWVLLAWAFILQESLLRHLKGSIKDRWEYVTGTIFGPGMRNAPRLFKYIFDDRDMEDIIVKSHKFRLRKLILYGGVSLVASIVTIIMTTLLQLILKG